MNFKELLELLENKVMDEQPLNVTLDGPGFSISDSLRLEQVEEGKSKIELFGEYVHLSIDRAFVKHFTLTQTDPLDGQTIVVELLNGYSIYIQGV